jgi:acetyl-CoA synthetase
MPDSGLVSGYAWEPTAERIAEANVTRLMNAAGVATIDELRRKSVADIDWFWDLVVRDLGLPFDEPYAAVRDSSRGIEWTTWFVGGSLNVATACVDRWREDPVTAAAPAVIHEDEAGKTSWAPPSMPAQPGCASPALARATPWPCSCQ